MLPPDSARAAAVLSIWILAVCVGASSGCSDCAPTSTTPSLVENTTFNPPNASSNLFQECNAGEETLTETPGTIRSPNYPLNYDNDHECTYHIRAPEGRVVVVYIADLQLEEIPGTRDCKYDYIAFYDGTDESSPELNQICSMGWTLCAKSSGRDMTVKFISDHSKTNRGFQLTYVDEPPECGGTISGQTSGWISSNEKIPEFCSYNGQAELYKNNALCTWKITVEPNLRIHLTFCEFEFEKCDNDYLSIVDGSREMTYCGDNLPEPFESSGNELTLTMVTDGSVRRKGFRARFTTINTQTILQEALTDNAGEIAFPIDRTVDYTQNSNCGWTISVEPGRHIVVSFTQFVIETSDNCTKDFLEIRNGGDFESSVLWKSCGSREEIPPIVSDSHQLYIRFVSDGDKQSSGFILQYTSEPGCGGNLSTHGIIQSPNYPNNFPPWINCTWTAVDLPQHYWIEIAFLDFDIGRSSQQDIYSGTYPDHTLGRCMEGAFLEVGAFHFDRVMCGSEIPAREKLANRDTLRFVSTNGTCGRGFQLKYEFGCIGNVFADQGNLSSPFFPNPHGVEVNCRWDMVPASRYEMLSNLITVNLTTVHLPDCQTQGLLIEDDNFNPIGSLICGVDAVPLSMVFLSRSFKVYYSSSPTPLNQGFELAWDVTECRFQLEGSSGSFASPLYPAAVPPRSYCDWSHSLDRQIRGYRMTLTFNVSWPNCENSPLTVYNGIRTQPVCANHTVFSTSSTIKIELRTIHLHSNVKFQASFALDCGGEVNADSGGNLKLRRNEASHSHTCTWTLKTHNTDGYVFFRLDSLGDGNAIPCEVQSLTIETFNSSNNVHRICGTPRQRYLTFFGPKLRITFSAGGNYSNIEFTGKYYTGEPPCGGEYTAESGTISSPKNLNGYYYIHNEHCTWSIVVPAGKRVVLNITDVAFADRHCYGLLEVRTRDGHRQSLCSSTNQSQIIISDTSVTLVFSVHSYNSYRGFTASYRIVDACGAVLSGPTGSVSLPSDRTVGEKCHWSIQAPEGKIIKLIITEYDYGLVVSSLQLPASEFPQELISDTLIWRENILDLMYENIHETSRFVATFVQLDNTSLCGSVMSDKVGIFMTPSNTSHCPGEGPIEWRLQADQNSVFTISFYEYDWRTVSTWDRQCSQRFTIYDGPNNESPVLYSDCSSSLGPSNTIVSTSNQVLFSLDKGSRNLRFVAAYEQICTQNFVTSSGAFTSPNYPNNYDHGSWCDWKIRVPANRRVTLTIHDFQLAVHNGSHGGPTDSITIYPVGARDGQVTLRGAGQSPEVYTSPGNYMNVALITSKGPGAMGFNASFVTTCGEILMARSVHASVDVPYDMDDSPLHCEWTIINGFESSMTIANVMFVDVPDSQNCTTDYVEVRYEETSRRVCGRQGSNVSISTAGNITVIYHQTSSFNGSYRGFGLIYTQRERPCNRNLTDPKGIITSPNFPGNYPNDKMCQWIIKAPEGQRIRLTFETFELEYLSSCGFDVVQLHNGNSTRSDRIARLCSESLPIPVTYTSRANSMLVYFRTDGSVTRTGFKANYAFESQPPVLNSTADNP